MSEGYIQNNQDYILPSVSEVDAVTAPDLSVSSGDLITPAPGTDPGAGGLYPQGAYGYYGMVSGGDLVGSYPWTEVLEAQSVALQDLSADTALLLAKIDFKLGAILSLILFSWCFKRVRAAVKGLTGRGLDE